MRAGVGAMEVAIIALARPFGAGSIDFTAVEASAFPTGRITAEPASHDFLNAGSNARLALHQCVQVIRVEHEQTGAGNGSDGRRPARPAQRCYLAKEMPGTQAHALVLERNLHLPG